MAVERSPAFQFYPKDFLADSHVVAMTLEERGAYVVMLCLCWLEGSLPNSTESLAKLCGVSPKRFSRLWPALAPCFSEDGGRITQPRIERERRKQADYRAMKVNAGKRGGRPKAEAKQKQSRGKPNQSPPSSSSVSDLLSSSSSSEVHRSADADLVRSGDDKPPKARKPRKALNDEPSAFDGFWADYPRKVGKAAARKVWDGLNPAQDVVDQIAGALVWQKTQTQWTRDGGQYIPHPVTWLRQARWLDEPVPREGAKL